MTSAGVYLRTYLEQLSPWLDDPDIADILINRPGEVWIEGVHGGLARVDAPGITTPILSRLAQQIAAASHQGVNREHPLLAATLPGGARVQVVAPPATREHAAFAIRKHVVADLTLDHYHQTGAFAHTRRSGAADTSELDRTLERQLGAGDIPLFLRTAIRGGKNIVVSGGTASGKTTFLNALLKEVPTNERIILIEDTPEVKFEHPNAVGLVAVKGELGEARVGVDELLQAALRMRPDRLLVGEIRGPEAFTFLRAINTGHPGSITTVHADSPKGALDQIAFMTLQAGLTLTRADVLEYAQSVIDVIVQLTRAGGMRAVSDIVFNGAR
ncbi:MAG: P-type DNA transfer ATPase VirB11 [Hyphomonadaceae bacterium]|nr:P-type DNA transfer ATPase VirB11 [Hyphomonadaceae bacterium]